MLTCLRQMRLGDPESRKIIQRAEVAMRNRIAMWAIAGFLVAGFWAIFAVATFPSTNERMRDVWILISFTCPVTMLRQYPISLYEVLAANTITYALVGLMLEALRHQQHHAK